MATPTRKLKPVQLDVWSIRERLTLACSVLRSGDQNWVSVSRAIKPFGETTRPPEWFTPKNCALQYSDLLEKVETPKRKRGERGEIETPGNQIARNLTYDRTEELKRLVQEEQQRYKKLKLEVEFIKSGQQDDKLKDMWEEIQQQKKAAEEAAAAAKQKAIDEAMAQAQATASSKLLSKTSSGAAVKTMKRPQPKQLRLITKESTPSSDQDDSTMDSIPETITVEVCEDSSPSPALQTSVVSATTTTTTTPSVLPSPQPEETKSTTPQSPLLSHLLKAKPKLSEVIPQQAPSTEEASPTTTSTTITTTTTTITTTAEKPPSPAPPQTAAATLKQVEIRLPCIDIKKEPEEVEEIKVEEKQSPPIFSPTPVTKATATDSAVTTVITASAVSKTEIPSSPSLGAPTLSKLLCNPVASPLPHKLTEVRPTTPQPEEASTTESSAPKESPPKSPVKASAPVSEPHVKEECTATKEESPCPPTAKPSTPTKHTPKPDQETKEECVPVSPTCAKLSLSSSVCVDEDISFKEEPASPASSIVSNVSETAPKVIKAKRGRPRGSRRSTRITRRSVTEKEETSSKQSEVDSSDDETIHESDDGMLSSSTPKLNFSLPSESVPNSPASMSQCSDTEDEKAYKVWKKSIMLVWRAAANHKYANVFLHPVTNDIAPGYTSVVYRPMDLHAIKKNVENGIIRTTAEFQRDMMLMFTNAIMYNSSDHNVNRMAGEMYNDVMMHIEQYVNTQMMVQTEPKMLRPSRRSDAPSDKEEEARRRRTSTDQHNIMESGGKSKKRKTRSDDN